MAFGITDLKKGTVFEYDKVPYKVVEYSQKVVGRGGSIVNVRLKSLLDGKVQDKTFKGNEIVLPTDIVNQTSQYLYKSNGVFHFMNFETFEQFEIAGDIIGDSAGYIKEGDQVTVQLYDGRVINIELPKNVYLKVAYTENAVKGDTSSAVLKEAELETGLKLKVPAFINTGDIISIDTATGTYRERKKA